MHYYSELIEFSPTFFVLLFNMLILFVVLRYFFWDKVKGFMDARQRALLESFEQAKSTNELADKKLEEYEARIADIESEAREIVRDARLKAVAQGKTIVENANKRATAMIMAAEKDIERQREEALSELQQQIAGLAIFAAERILEKQLDINAQDEMFNKILKEAGNVKWQN